jgi:hypothetical protein
MLSSLPPLVVVVPLVLLLVPLVVVVLLVLRISWTLPLMHLSPQLTRSVSMVRRPARGVSSPC